MKLYLDNIGKVCDSTIIVDGLTVITGENNSGKTTVGKTLYSIVSAVENLQQTALVDTRDFAVREIRRALNHFELYRTGRFEYYSTNRSENTTVIDSIFNFESRQIENNEDILSTIDDLVQELTDCSEDDIYKFFDSTNSQKNHEMNKKVSAFIDNFMKRRGEVAKSISEIKKTLQEDPDLSKYTNTRIIKNLQDEFYDQIKGITNDNKKSKIQLYDDNEQYYNISILDNDMESHEKVFLSSAFDSSLFVDDVTVIDDMNLFTAGRRIIRNNHSFVLESRQSSYESFLHGLTNQTHRKKLIEKLVTSNGNLFEETVYKTRAETVLSQIKRVYLGRPTFTEGRYIVDGLDIRNLAMGSKMFLIIKILLENGHCGPKTLLVLDEPESHLHPAWQNIFAEAIVLLIKILKTTVILTTHSPNFLLAIDVFTKKHKTRDVTHFYRSAFLEGNKKVRLESIDANINEAYADMTKPFLELEAMSDPGDNIESNKVEYAS